ncbi:MAG: PAS domain S-box protein [Spirochaetes bacterium]|nr:MAG: PAS domain S-box protein [Spirochaetota bacterium]
MKLKDIMTVAFPSLGPECSIREAAAIFLAHRTDSAPIVDSHGSLLGLFTTHHINHAVSMDMGGTTPVGSLMKVDVKIGNPDERVEDIIYFDQGQLPVVDSGRVVGMISRTCFARAVAEKYQRTSSEFKAIINSTSYMIIQTDTDCIINVFNRAAEKILGLGAEFAVGKNISEVLPGIDFRSAIESGHEILPQKVMVRERPYIMSSYPVEMNGTLIGVVSRFQDISELEKISHELENVKELNRDLDAIIESSYDGIWVTDGDANVLRINKAYETITGLPCSSFYGRNMRDLVREGFFSQSVTLLVLEKRSPQTIFQETKTGKSLLVTGNPIFKEKGEIIRVVTNVRDITELKQLIEKLDESQRIARIFQSELNDLRNKYKKYDKIVWNSLEMKKFIDSASKIALVNSTVLVVGESGTGKELVAEFIHTNSSRTSMPLIKVNCGAIPESLIESELLGYESGAFTGARRGGKPGYFEIANNGTLFLDEIAEMPFNLQAKLLRVLEAQEVTRIGGKKPQQIDVRVIAATNKNLIELVNANKFRGDLYYRLNVVPLVVPPLRDRKDDIPYLVAHFVSMFNRTLKMTKRILPEVVDVCMELEWPGNIRELKNLVERLMVLSAKDLIGIDDLPQSFRGGRNATSPGIILTALMPYREAITSVERQLLQMAYSSSKTTRQMAEDLKINASTIVRKAAKYGITHAAIESNEPVVK